MIFNDLVIYDLMIEGLQSPNHQITKSPDHQITKSRDHQITRSPDRNEEGAAAVTLAMSVGVVIGLLAVGVVAMGGSAGREFHHLQRVVEGLAEERGRMNMGVALLANRLQDTLPVTAHDLMNLLPNTEIEDEGGKLSLPLTAYAMPAVMEEFGVDNVFTRVGDLTAAVGMSLYKTPAIAYPLEVPRPVMKPVRRFESPEEVGAFWGLSDAQTAEMRRWFTACQTVGVNINTADPRCVMGVVKWQRAASVTWAGRVAAGADLGGDPVTGFNIHLYPLPGQEQVVIKDPPQKPEDILVATLPTETLFPTDPHQPYNSLWQLVQVAVKSPVDIGIKWLRPPPPFTYAYFASETVPFAQTYGSTPYHVRGNAWVKGAPVTAIQPVVDQRPYALNDLTQPLGLFWYTPEGWFTPLTSAAVGQFDKVSWNEDRPPKALNIALGAAAFTGWLSLQGAGPFRAGSEWYTLTARVSHGWTSVTTRIIVRVFPDEMPTIVSSAVVVE